MMDRCFKSKEEAETWRRETEFKLLQHKLELESAGNAGVTREGHSDKEIPELPPKRRAHIEAVLSGALQRTMNTKFKAELIKFGFLIEQCVSCGGGPTWHGRRLVLHLDHVNGNREDNRRENLRMLCPNCHSQTPTYAGRNRKRKANATKGVVNDENLKQALIAASSVREALVSLGLSGSGANYIRARKLLLLMIREGTAPNWA